MTSNLTGPQTGKPGLGFIPDWRGCPRADRPAGGVFSGVSGPGSTASPPSVRLRQRILRKLLRFSCGSLPDGCKSRTLRWKRPRSCPSASARSAQTSRRGQKSAPQAPDRDRRPGGGAAAARPVCADAPRRLAAGERAGGSGWRMFLKHSFKNSAFGDFSRKTSKNPRKIFSKKGCNLCKQNVLYY